MNSYRLHFIRHGITQGNQKGIYIGSTDLPLCREGEGVIKKLVAEYDYPKVGKVYVSPLKRCISTAKIIYPETFTEKVSGLRECDFGVFEGKTIAELKNTPEFLKWIENCSKKSSAPPEGESGEQVLERSVAAIDYIVKDMMKLKIYDAAVITHGGIIMSLFAACGYPKANMNDWVTDSGKGYTVRIDPRLWMTDNIFEVIQKIPFDKSK